MSEILVIAPPQDRAVTLEEARQQLRLDARDEDLLLGAKLDAAQASGDSQKAQTIYKEGSDRIAAKFSGATCPNVKPPTP